MRPYTPDDLSSTLPTRENSFFYKTVLLHNVRPADSVLWLVLAPLYRKFTVLIEKSLIDTIAKRNVAL